MKLRETCIDQVSPLQAELGKAQTREKLEVALGEIASGSNVVQVGSSDPGSIVLASYFSTLGVVIPVEIVGQWLVLVPVLALEIGSAMAALLVPPTITTPVNSKCERTGYAGELGNVGSRRGARVARRETEEQILRQLKDQGGSMWGSERGLSQELRVSKPTVRRALQTLDAEGRIKRSTSHRGTFISIPL